MGKSALCQGHGLSVLNIDAEFKGRMGLERSYWGGGGVGVGGFPSAFWVCDPT